MEGLPRISAATLANAPPFEEEPSAFSFTRPGIDGGREFRADLRLIASDYFAVLGIRLVRGRPFEIGDGRPSPRVAIVSETLARSAWGGANAIGQRISLGDEDAQVVGIAGDVRTTGLDGDVSHTVYVPAAQHGFNFMTVAVKTRGDARAVAPSIQRLVREVDGGLPLYHVRTLDELVASSVAQQRFQMFVVSAFAVIVFALASIGTHGVASYGVSERLSEVGIRVALGASRANIKRLVLHEGARLTIIGVAIGGAAAVALGGVLTKLVFQISPRDTATFIAAPVLLLSATLIATYVPARRATRVDPMRVLRAD